MLSRYTATSSRQEAASTKQNKYFSEVSNVGSLGQQFFSHVTNAGEPDMNVV